jgi:hypothetical protein
MKNGDILNDIKNVREYFKKKNNPYIFRIPRREKEEIDE